MRTDRRSHSFAHETAVSKEIVVQNLRAAFAALMLVVAAVPAIAQTTAGASTAIVVPVTAQTASFSSEVTVFNPNAVPVTMDVAFYEANNSSAPGAKTCTDAVVPAGKSIQFTLASQCALGAGSHFGLLVLSELLGTKPIHAFARVQNPQGIGFSVEGFPAENFNNQVSHATGLKKTTSGLIYQTNCFAGSLASPVTYTLKLFDGTSGSQIGSTINGSLAAFQQIRYLDVFGPSGVNAANVDQLNVRAEFTSTNNALLVGFCTVQDNTSFGADFRIAKSYGTTAGFVQGGNTFGTTAILGTNDNQALEIRVNGSRVMRYEPSWEAFGTYSPNVIGGHPENRALAGVLGATIGGGGDAVPICGAGGVETCANLVSAGFGTVAGGAGNMAGNLAGNSPNEAYPPSHNTVVGGMSNIASDFAGTVSGGHNNRASGGVGDPFYYPGGTIAGGSDNIAVRGTVAGGLLNRAEDGTIAGGENNYASFGGTVAGGKSNVASGQYSFAAGYNAKALHMFSFVWGGSAVADTNSTADGDFVVNAPGGVRMMVGASGCTLTSGASGWSCTSDRRLKSDIEAVDGLDVLNRVVALPVARWSFSSVPGIAHMGPMAQDFHAAFNLGDDETRLAPMDVQGVALAAIQGLNAKLEARLAEVRTERQAQAAEIAELKRAVEVLLARTSPEGRFAAAR
jgi:hypothetical protein